MPTTSPDTTHPVLAAAYLVAAGLGGVIGLGIWAWGSNPGALDACGIFMGVPLLAPLWAALFLMPACVLARNAGLPVWAVAVTPTLWTLSCLAATLDALSTVRDRAADCTHTDLAALLARTNWIPPLPSQGDLFSLGLVLFAAALFTGFATATAIFLTPTRHRPPT